MQLLNESPRSMTGRILNIQHYCLYDGPGIRTTVFLMGCPLRCAWCHNPETHTLETKLSYNVQKCVSCGRCEKRCPAGCHTFYQGRHIFNRTGCIPCGRCITPTCSALEIYGKSMSVEAVMEEVKRDTAFFQTSGGGLTLSGGEPFFQFDYAIGLLRSAKQSGIHTCVETCGFLDRKKMTETASWTDLYLYDWKVTDSALHRRCTGQGNELILSNLLLLDSMGKAVILRCPIIPGINDTAEHFRGIGQLANRLTHLVKVELEPFHAFCKDKYSGLGQSWQMENTTVPSAEMSDDWVRGIQVFTAKPVCMSN